MGWFKWKGVQMPNFLMMERTPAPVRAERVTSIMDMPNNVPIIYQSKGYKTVNISVVLGFRPHKWDKSFMDVYATDKYTEADYQLMDFNELANVQYDAVYNWLQGAGTLTFSTDPDKYYQAVCNVQIIPDRLSRKLNKFNVQFTCMPFRYSLINEPTEIPLSGLNEQSNIGTIYYEGTEPSEPTIKVYCNGTQTIAMDFGNVGSSTFVKLLSVTDSATIDVPTRRVYDANGNVILNTVEGDITALRLVNPTTRIVIDKTCTKVEVMNNTRWR